MHTQNEDLEALIGDSDNLIMSEGLELDFGEIQEDVQKLTLDSANIDFVCNLMSASSTVMQSLNNRVWELEIEVPGLSFGDLLDVTKIIYDFNGKIFESITNFAWTITESGPVITFTAKRIFNNNE